MIYMEESKKILPVKLCRKCGEFKPLSNFTKDRNGYMKKCKQCVREEAREKYHADPEYREKQIARSKEWNESHKKICNQRSRDYYNTHKKKT
jgi:hypothetical protein